VEDYRAQSSSNKSDLFGCDTKLGGRDNLQYLTWLQQVSLSTHD